nr:MAG TPA: hypothetical protein [Caudoviricetes sp.]
MRSLKVALLLSGVGIRIITLFSTRMNVDGILC